MLDISKVTESFNTESNYKRISSDTDRYYIYNGKIKDIIESSIKKEFILPETVRDMAARIVPINITQKIIAKLAKVYASKPIRRPKDLNESDADALSLYIEEMDFDRKMNHANNMFKLHKHVALEPFLSSKGEPEMRVLPSQTYSLYSDDPIDPTRITAFIKHIKFDVDKKKQVHEIWTDEDFVIVDGEGNVLFDQMLALNNPEGVNPYGILPFTVIRETDDLLLPIQDDDLINMNIQICLLLTDLSFAAKFQSWSIFYLIGVNNEKISFNPNSVISLEHIPGTEKPEIGTIKPELDSDAMLRQVEALVSMLLTTKSLSVGQISGSIQANNPASGIAKVLDQAETTEEREVQVSYFSDAEKDFWYKFAHYILPEWLRTGAIDREYAFPFSTDFELSIVFPDQAYSLGPKEELELIKMKLDMGLIGLREALRTINPELSEEEIDMKLLEINKQKLDNVKFFQKNIAVVDDQEESPQDQNKPDVGNDNGSAVSQA